MRPAEPGDLGAIAAIARAAGQPDRDSAVDPGYTRHLLAAGRLLVADEPGGPVGFAGTLEVGRLRLLTDLFVRPDRQGDGIGGRLLDAALAGATARATFASSDPRAVALYARAGLRPAWTLFYLARAGGSHRPGDRASARPAGDRAAEPEWVTEWVSADVAADAERRLSGLDREREYRYWAGALGGHAFLLRAGPGSAGRAPLPVAAGVLLRGGPDRSDCLRHLVTAPGDAPAALRAALAGSRGPVELCLPGAHPGLAELLAAGFRITGSDLAMVSGAAVDATQWVVSPAML